MRYLSLTAVSSAISYWSQLLLLLVVAGCFALPAVSPADEILRYDGTIVSGSVEVLDGKTVTLRPVDGDVIDIPLEELQSVDFIPEPYSVERSRILIDTSGGRGKRSESGSIKLRAGQHQLAVTYFQNDGPTQLNIEWEGPDLERQPLKANSLSAVSQFHKIKRSEGVDDEGFRLPDQPTDTKEKVTYRLKQWDRPTDVEKFSDLRLIPVKRYAGQKGMRLDMNHPDRNFAVDFQAFVDVPADGEYTFHVEATGNVVFAVGVYPAAIQVSSNKVTDDKWVVETRDKGELSGRLLGWSEGSLDIETPITQSKYTVPIPTAWIRGLWRGSTINAETPLDRADEPTDLDSLYAIGNDDQVQRVAGTVVGIEEDKLQFEFNGKARTVPLEKVVGIAFAARELPVQPSVSGSILLPRQQRLPGIVTAVLPMEKLIVTTPWGAEVTLLREHVIRQTVRGGRLQWLSELEPTSVEEVPLFSYIPAWQNDQSLTGSSIRIGEAHYRRGVAQHSRSTLTYNLDGLFTRFQSDVGLLLPDGTRGIATVRIRVDGEVTFEKESLAMTDGALPVDLDVSGKKQLVLEVDFGDMLDVGDHIGWGNARLLRAQ